MAIISIGYTGDIDETAWAQITARMSGSPYGVRDLADWRVTLGAADREVRIAPGVGYGAGILDEVTSEVRLALPAPGSGAIWHMIVARRSWQNNTTTFASIAGGTQQQLPNRAARIGEVDEQPIALAKVEAGKSQVTDLIDLRVWKGPGGATAQHRLVLEYLTILGTQIAIGASLWARVLSPSGNAVWVDHNAGRLLAVHTLRWFGMAPSGSLPGQGVSVWGNPAQIIADFNLDDPGVPYRVQMYAEGFWGRELDSSGARIDFDMVVDDTAIATFIPAADQFNFGNSRTWSPPASRQVFEGGRRLGFRARRIVGNPWGACREAQSVVIASIYSA